MLNFSKPIAGGVRLRPKKAPDLQPPQQQNNPAIRSSRVSRSQILAAIAPVLGALWAEMAWPGFVRHKKLLDQEKGQVANQSVT